MKVYYTILQALCFGAGLTLTILCFQFNLLISDTSEITFTGYVKTYENGSLVDEKKVLYRYIETQYIFGDLNIISQQYVSSAVILLSIIGLIVSFLRSPFISFGKRHEKLYVFIIMMVAIMNMISEIIMPTWLLIAKKQPNFSLIWTPIVLQYTGLLIFSGVPFFQVIFKVHSRHYRYLPN